jgi:uncharacterized MnhB-related membrane protein
MSVDRFLLGAIIVAIIVTALGGLVEAVTLSSPDLSATESSVGANRAHEQAALPGARMPPG